MAKIVAVTSCPTGIAHTFMAAESLQRAAQAQGHTTKVDMSRFAGKPRYETTTQVAIHDGQEVVKNALAQVTARPTAPAATMDTPKKIVAITSCPTGIAHTFMAAEGLQKGAEALG